LSGFRLGERIRRGGRASRRTAGEFADVDAGFAVGDVLEGGALAIVIVAALVLMTILLPFVVVAGELVVAILLALLGIAGRVLFRRPWIVEAVSEGGERHRWRVVGWFRSRELVADVASALAHGNGVPRSDPAGGPTVDGAPSASP
jgi:hypothetical protein